MLSWAHLLRWRAERHPDLLALADDRGQQLTYRELHEEVERLAGGWAAQGVGPGDVVAILARNRVDWISHMYALNRAGAIAAAVNWRLAPPELAALLDVMRPAAVLADAENLALLNAAAPGLPRVVLRAAGTDGLISGRASDDFHGPVPAWPAGSMAGNKPFVLLHTSGTTGAVPKLVAISNARLVASGTYLKLVVPEAQEGARHLRAMPLFHMAGLANVTYPLFTGGTTYIQSAFRPKEFVDAIVDKQINFTNLVPSAIAMVVEELRGRETPADLSSLVEIGYGASSISPEALRAAIEALGCRFRQNYGSTETGGFPITTLDPADQYPESPHLNTAGKAALNWEVRIVDDNLEDVPDGEPGELIVRGSEPFDGYWNNPAETAAAIDKDGFWHIGDIAVRDADGYITIVDRKKDMIVSGGENVYPAEVEAALHRHPDVAEASVIGIPDPRWGESVHAVLVLRVGGAESADAIKEWSRGQLAGFKCPTTVEFLDELPRNATGKILKRTLREKFWADETRAVS
ncbi:class I adenylate-forming enzyme family protein [Tomitella biformata]|uniref:class I adenylate-forming enzyme family protein n=1 Tax=Tomitella biformata TaxID=630403 RepID=UPI000467C89B|nr:AMP-binding protein [Tomitella biformata]